LKLLPNVAALASGRWCATVLAAWTVRRLGSRPERFFRVLGDRQSCSVSPDNAAIALTYIGQLPDGRAYLSIGAAISALTGKKPG